MRRGILHFQIDEGEFMHEVLDWVYSIVVALFLAMLIHIFLFVPTKVSGESMYPTLTNGEYLIVSKISHVLREMPNYGDIVIIDSRTHRERSWMDDLDEPMKNYIAIFDKSSQGHNVWVKRVIGKGGDKLEFKNGHVYRNGSELDEPYINEPMEFSMDGSYTVPEGMVFVMGGQSQPQLRQPVYRPCAGGPCAGQSGISILIKKLPEKSGSFFDAPTGPTKGKPVTCKAPSLGGDSA